MKDGRSIGGHAKCKGVFVFLFLLAMIAVSGVKAYAQNSLWSSAYYAGWMQGCGSGSYLRADQIDFAAVTHIIHFALVPNSDGSLDSSVNCISSGNSTSIVSAAHAAGRKVLISVGGWGTESKFLSATGSSNRAKFINNLIDFMKSRGYDGIDLDWEPLSSSSSSQYITFVTELRNAMNALSPKPLLTAAVASEPSVFAKVQDSFDQINIMTYDLSGPWEGWVTWHHAALYDGGYRFPSTGALVPSADGMVTTFLSAGVRPEKLGVGIEFYGWVWSGGTGTSTGGVTAPRQSWTTPPTRQWTAYYDIKNTYYQPGYFRWDSSAQAAYLSIDASGSSGDKFITYDEEQSCDKKIRYAKSKGLGGIMIFELGGGWMPNATVRDSLLQAVKSSLQAVQDSSPSPPRNLKAL